MVLDRALGERGPDGPLSLPNFRLLFGGQLVSLFGDHMTLVALPFAVLAVTGSAAHVGLVLAAGIVPQVVFLLAGGVFGDRLCRRSVMLAADAVRFAGQGTLAALLLAGHAQLWHLVVAEVVRGTAAAFFLPAATGLLPQIVDSERLQSANALLGMTKAATAILAAAVAGGLAATAGPGFALGVDAVSFLVSAAFLVRIAVPRQVARGAAPTIAGSLVEGWREFASRAWLWRFVVWFALFNALVVAPVQVLGPVLSGPAAWGAIVAGMGAGSLAGGALVARIRPRRPLLVAALAYAALAPQVFLLGTSAPVATIVAAALAGGAGLVAGNALWETTLQQRVPNHVLSRISAYDWLGSLAFLPLGFVLAGVLATTLGAHAMLELSGVFLLASLGVLVVSLRETPRPFDWRSAVRRPQDATAVD